MNNKTTRMLLVSGALAIYFGYSHDSSNVIPAELKFGFGITTLILGLVGLYLNRSDASGTKKE